MKKHLFFVAIAMVVVASCTSPSDEKFSKKDLVVSMTADTTVFCKEPITKDRFACNGKKLEQPKLVGQKTTPVPISLKRNMKISADSLAKKGFYYLPAGLPVVTEKADLYHPELSLLWFVELAKGLFWVLLCLAIIYGLFWLLFEFLHWIPVKWRDIRDRYTYSRKSTKEVDASDNQKKSDSAGCGTIDAIVKEMRYNGGNMEVKINVNHPREVPDQK